MCLFCAGSDVVQGGKCLVAWNNVAKPLELGGLDIKDLRLLGGAEGLLGMVAQNPTE